jgi:hypothetical protein
LVGETAMDPECECIWGGGLQDLTVIFSPNISRGSKIVLPFRDCYKSGEETILLVRRGVLSLERCLSSEYQQAAIRAG